MKALIQRVKEARVAVGEETVGEIKRGLLVFLGVKKGDAEEDSDRLAGKTAALRIFEDAQGKMNLSVLDIGGEALVISQFTLLADTRKGNRPSFQDAEQPERAEKLYLAFIDGLKKRGVKTATGRFAAGMAVHLINDGPVTIMLESG